MVEPTFCDTCANVVEKKGPSYQWLCIRFPCPGGEGYVTGGHWEKDSPYRQCKDINKHGACPLYEKEKTNESK